MASRGFSTLLEVRFFAIAHAPVAQQACPIARAHSTGLAGWRLGNQQHVCRWPRARSVRSARHRGRSPSVDHAFLLLRPFARPTATRPCHFVSSVEFLPTPDTRAATNPRRVRPPLISAGRQGLNTPKQTTRTWGLSHATTSPADFSAGNQPKALSYRSTPESAPHSCLSGNCPRALCRLRRSERDKEFHCRHNG